ncbi:MAG: aldo/keto reductase [Beijerinckiaceae bacterium]
MKDRTTLLSKIGFGTAQFGLAYGITNTDGQVPRSEVRAILDDGGHAGIRVIDTAALYGESEQVIGEALSMLTHPFRIVTKTAKNLEATSAVDAADGVRAAFVQSLERLRQPVIDAVIVHDCRELLGPHGDARWRAMQDLKQAGMVRRIGASVYTGAEIDALLSRFDPDLVQAPMNAVDRRLFTGGQLDQLAARGVAVHARSLFLQGLLLQAPEQLDRKFAALAAPIASLRQAAKDRGVGLPALLLHTVLQHPAIECALVGVTSRSQWQDLKDGLTADLSSLHDFRYSSPPIGDERLLNPSQWHLLK